MSDIVKHLLRRESIFTLTNFFTEFECQKLISFSEERGYSFATVAGSETPSFRNNSRVDLEDSRRAEQLFRRAQPFLPRLPNGKEPVGIHRRLRFYRYEPQQQFKWHGDGSVTDECGNSSAYTFLIYLNEDFDGGQTAFYNSKEDPKEFEVEPTTGLALLFIHTWLHRGVMVSKGQKYVLRSDILYG